MKKRNLSLLLVALILCVQIFSGLGLAYANEDKDNPKATATATANEDPKDKNDPKKDDETPGPTENPEITIKGELKNAPDMIEAGNKYLYPANAWVKVKMEYTLKIKGYDEDLYLLEEINGQAKRIEIPKGTGDIKIGGQEVYLEQEVYDFKYNVVDEGGNVVKLGSTMRLEPVRTDFNISYTADKSDSIFINDLVTFTVTVESKSNVIVENIVVSDKDLGELGRIDSLAPNSQKTITKTIKMEKGTDGTIVLKHSDPLGVREEEQKIFPTSVNLKVSNVPRSTGISIETVPDISAIPGEATINVALVIKNIGNTRLKNIKVTDWNGEVVYSSPGPLTPADEITRNLTLKVKPDTTYKFRAEAEADEGATAVGDSQFILSKLDPRIEILRDIPTGIVAGKPFIIEYTIKNIGNVDIRNILVEEPEMGEVATINELLSGEELVKTVEFTVNDNVVSKTKLKALVSDSGSEYEYSASDIVINVQPDGVKHQIAMVLRANTETLDEPDTISLECIVKNTGTEALNNLRFVLMDREMMIQEIIVLEPGEEQKLLVTPFRLEETEDFYVRVDGYDSENAKFTDKSDTLTITVVNPGKSRNPNVLRTILIIIALLCLIIIGILVYMSRDSIKKWFNKIRKVA